MSYSRFFESSDGGIVHQFAYFSVGEVEYIIDFSTDDDIVESISELDTTIAEILHGKQVYTVKFAVRAYYESQTEADLYAPPPEHHFGRKEINSLKIQLETLLYHHYLQFKPDCYFFIAERPSLVRMYQKMCDKRDSIMLDFVPITKLGDNHDSFILKTPNYKE
ncbi:helicase [Testudinibacter sp. P27/CKL/0425]